jgi:predicted DNA-binding antitoxin AbrB/MazE fold protein
MARANQRVLNFEEGVLKAIELLDNCDGSRLELVNTLDEVRETLVDSYGNSFQDDYDELLGIDENSDEIEEIDEEPSDN